MPARKTERHLPIKKVSHKLHFSKREAIDYGFDIAKKNIRFFLKVFIVAAVIYLLLQILKEMSLSGNNLLPYALYTILSWLVGVVLSMGFIKISLEFIDKSKPEVSDLLYTNSIINYILVTIVRSVIVLIGFILFIIPGIILSIKFQFAEYLVVDKNMGVQDALETSWKMTKGVKWDIFVFLILLVLINIVGVIALVVGLFITIPLTMVATAFVYRKLLSQIS